MTEFAISVGFAVFASIMLTSSTGPGKLFTVLRATSSGIVKAMFNRMSVAVIITSLAYWFLLEAASSSLGVLVVLSALLSLTILRLTIGVKSIALVVGFLVLAAITSIPFVMWFLYHVPNVTSYINGFNEDRFLSIRMAVDYLTHFVVRAMGTAGLSVFLIASIQVKAIG